MATARAGQKALLKQLERLQDAHTGWSVRSTSNGNLRATAPDGAARTLSPTGDTRGQRNDLAWLKRHGFHDQLAELDRADEQRRVDTIAADRAKAAAAAVRLSEGAPVATATTSRAPARTSRADDEYDVSPLSGMFTRSVLVDSAWVDQHLGTEDHPVELPELNGRQLRQRTCNWRQVRRWADLMETGKFHESPQGIVLAPRDPDKAPHGSVLDGMHRLEAVRERDLKQWFRVTFDCPPEQFAIFDVGNKRNAAHTLQIAGEKDGMRLASALKLLHCYIGWLNDPPNYPHWRSWSRMRPENSVITEVLDQHSGIRDIVSEYAGLPVRAFIVPSSFHVFYYVASIAWPGRSGAAKLEEFAQRIDDGAGIEKGNPAHTTRQWFIRRARDPMHNKRERHLHILLQGFGKHVAGEECWQLKVTDDWPMVRPPSPRGGRPVEELMNAVEL